jgi:hypothetical protein
MTKKVFGVVVMFIYIPFLIFVVLPYWGYCGLISKIRRRRSTP